MLRRLAIAVLAVCLFPASTFAQSIRDAVQGEAIRLAQSQRPAARGRNPYSTPALVLIGGGAGLFVLAFLAPSGVDCDVDNDFNVDCGTTANKGLLFSGLGAMGVGAYLYFKGENMRGPNIKPIPGGIVVRQRIKF